MAEATVHDGLLSNQSVVWVATENVELQHRNVSEMGPKYVLVEVIVTGICGSDAHVWASSPAKQPPIMGHESAGTIIRVGSQVTDRTVGQMVAIEPSFSCMECEFCIRGQTNIYANLTYCGHTVNGTLYRVFCLSCADGSANSQRRDMAGGELYSAIEYLSATRKMSKFACSSKDCSLVSGIQHIRIRRMEVDLTNSGCGPLGLLVMEVAKSYGVSKIIACDIEQSRIDFALKHCADVGIQCPLNTESVEPLAFATDCANSVIREHGLGSGFDVTIEASGADACMQMGVMITKNGSTYVQAVLGELLSMVPMFQVAAKELTIKDT